MTIRDTSQLDILAGGTAAFAYFIPDKLTIIVLTNGRTNVDALVNGIAGIYIPGWAPR
jgi:hypothetical protein